ncbi:hypothetical protein [Polyangium spumosum]|uniref:Uncharacterized protein n=1 Tax=Polyangium spumosum TaxID=889282 RepID=A0A6N7Q3B7_9BACT|nr:hypothetical protein [Polyangium spumosum]MRG98187.1 hypothetical protein [Polyangium spumosum]
MGLADKIMIDPPCPKCGTKLKIPLSQARAGMGTTCPSCGAKIKFKGDGGGNAMSKLEDAFKKLGK